MRRISRIKLLMNTRQHLIAIIERFAEIKGLSPSRVTTLALNSGHIYRRLVDGSDITVGRLEDAVQWFSNNWPSDTAWPEGLRRPAPKSGDAA